MLVFSQRFLETMSGALYSLVRDAFVSGDFNPAKSETLVVLIPQIDNSEYVKSFRPISLSCLTYKLITKVSLGEPLETDA